MGFLFNIILLIQIIAAMAMIGLILLQHGKGADMGASFGSGASGSLFGATGSANFLSRSTAVAATVFFASTLALGYLDSRPTDNAGVMGSVMAPTKAVTTAPAGMAAVPGTVPAAGASAAKH